MLDFQKDFQREREKTFSDGLGVRESSEIKNARFCSQFGKRETYVDERKSRELKESMQWNYTKLRNCIDGWPI